MTSLASEVIGKLSGKTLATAESCTGGMIGQLLTAVSGASAVYKGGVISYTNEVKRDLLGVDGEMLERLGAVSAPVAEAMATGVRQRLNAGDDLDAERIRKGIQLLHLGDRVAAAHIAEIRLLGNLVAIFIIEINAVVSHFFEVNKILLEGGDAHNGVARNV